MRNLMEPWSTVKELPVAERRGPVKNHCLEGAISDMVMSRVVKFGQVGGVAGFSSG